MTNSHIPAISICSKSHFKKLTFANLSDINQINNEITRLLVQISHISITQRIQQASAFVYLP